MAVWCVVACTTTKSKQFFATFRLLLAVPEPSKKPADYTACPANHLDKHLKGIVVVIVVTILDFLAGIQRFLNDYCSCLLKRAKLIQIQFSIDGSNWSNTGLPRFLLMD